MNLTRTDFITDQEVRWCPGCGDYAILSALQRTFPELGIPRENIVFISGIGCSGRFPYYMNTYGFHTIHGRAPAIASGLKLVRPDLSVWVITGDGDGLSIGANHLLHLLRRNFDIKVLLFNNQIYGLTKGQYSPTSERGKITTTTPGGSIDSPINPIAFALTAGATFVARVLDIDAKNLNTLIKKAAAHKGSTFIEIYQNCNIFNDGAFSHLSDKALRDQNTRYFQEGCEDLSKAFERAHTLHPVPMGIFREVSKPVYEEQLNAQNNQIQSENLASSENLNKILHTGHTWSVS